MDLHALFLIVLSFPAEALVKSNYTICFWLTVAVAGLFVSWFAALLVGLGALFTLLASFGRRRSSIPRYTGNLDVFFGRSYRASTNTADMHANNNVTISTFNSKFVIAYRKADSHFASPLAQIVVATANPDNLEEWTEVWRYTTGADDLREMLFFQMHGKLYLFYARLAPDKRGFSPRGMHWTSTTDLKVWSDPLAFGRATEIVWDVKVRTDEHGKQTAYKASYVGNHYAGGAICSVMFERSNDGVNWEAVGKDPCVYSGGICEVSFAFTPAGDLVAIGRNEDGDATGFGSQLFFARKGDLGSWTPLKMSLPHRFDSPRMVCLEGEVLLFARYAREPYALLPDWFPFGLQALVNIVTYSVLPKSGAVYNVRLPSEDGKWTQQPVELIRCFEETFGDTGFFSVTEDPTSGDCVVANYASADCHSHAAWFYGQLFPTNIYVCRCKPFHRGRPK